MDLTFSAEDEAFRTEVRQWLEDNLTGEFARLKGLGGSGREHETHEARTVWNRHLAAAGRTCLGRPVEYGGRGLSLFQQVIFHEEYARADAPARVNHLGEELLGPTLIAHGIDEQRRRFLPGIVKVWTSLAQHADWCFAVVRSEPGSRRHAGLSYLLVSMDQDGVEIRPIQQLTGTSEFNEVFFDGAVTDAGLVVGDPGDGWRVAMATLGFERGVSTIGQQVGFARELDLIIDAARANGRIDDPDIADRIARAVLGLDVLRTHVLRTHALRTLSGYDSGSQGPEASVSKLLWARWHRELGELAMDVLGGSALTVQEGPYELDRLQSLFLFSRADTIYGGSDEIQRNIIAERVLGLPKEPRG